MAADATAPPHVQLRGLTKGYQEGEQFRTVLDDLHLTIAKGEMVVLLGRSGAGKSTLLNLISGIDRADSGEVILGDTNLTTQSEHARTLFRREHIGFVFQSFNLIPTLTVEENILLPLELNQRSSSEDRERALHFLEEVGLRDRRGTFPDRLSGGEQQRVAIARALAHDPLLILADEPTGNLDYETGQQVLDVLDRLVRQAGRTMLVATHDHDLRAVADRVLFLQGGTLDVFDPSSVPASR